MTLEITDIQIKIITIFKSIIKIKIILWMLAFSVHGGIAGLHHEEFEISKSL